MRFTAKGESTIGRVSSAAGDRGIASRCANAADAPAPPEPFGRPGIAARGLLYFHHGLLSCIIGCALLFGFIAGGAPAAERIPWMYDINAALAAAKSGNKPLMIDFMADWCAPCKEMERLAFSNPAVILKAKSFVPVRINIDRQRSVAAKYNALARAYGGVGIPNMLFLKSDGTKIKHAVGYYGPDELLSLMNSVLKNKLQ